MIIYGEDDPQSALLERHFPRQEFATNVHHGFVRLSMSLMLDLAQYVAYDRTHKYTFGPGGVLPVARELRHDDVHRLDTTSSQWEKLEIGGYLAEPRSGHVAAFIGDAKKADLVSFLAQCGELHAGTLPALRFVTLV